MYNFSVLQPINKYPRYSYDYIFSELQISELRIWLKGKNTKCIHTNTVVILPSAAEVDGNCNLGRYW